MIRTFIESQETYKFIQRLFGNSQRTSYGYSENVLAKYQNLLEYKHIHTSSKRLNQLKINQPITLSKGLQLGASSDDVRKLFSITPFVKTFTSNGLRRTILLYKIKMGDQKIKMEAHFFKNQLFYCQYKISTFSAEENKIAITELCLKYGLVAQDFICKNIVDATNNCLNVNDDQELTISYIQIENPFFALVQQKLELEFNTPTLSFA